MKSKKVVLVILGLFIITSLSSYARAQEQKKMFILAEIGGLLAGNAEGGEFDPDRFRHDGKYALGRVGLVYKIIPGAFDWFVAGGGAVITSGGPSKSFFTLTSGFTAHYSSFGFSLGVTYATDETPGDWDLTNFHLTFGTMIDVIKSQSNTGSLVLEWQHPMRYSIGQGKGGSLYFKAIVGFRYLF